MRSLTIIACLCLCIAQGYAQTKPADKKKKEDAPKEKDKGAKADSTAKKNPLAEKLKTCKADSGLFTFYRDTTSGSVYMLLKYDQLNQEYIHFVYSENGVAHSGHIRGMYKDNHVFSLRRYYGRIEFVKENTHYYFDPTNALSKASDANLNKPILLSQKIVAEDSTAGKILLSADDIFMSEALFQIKPSPGPWSAMSFQLGGLNRDKSRIGKIRTYPENVDLLVDYTFDNPYPIVGGGPDVADARAVTITFQHSFIRMPKNDFVPRLDDARVGYFATQVDNMTTTESANFRDLIHRWHLVKKDPTAAVSEPVEPITWWIEKTTPMELRGTIREAGLAWNEAFEAAGFRNAVVIKEQPDTASWDAGDIRYNVLRWTSSPEPFFGGYGPSMVNPRTGQILGADIMLEWVFLTNRVRYQKLFLDKGLSWEETEPEHHPTGQHLCTLSDHLQHNLNFAQAFVGAQMEAPAENGKINADSDLIKQSLYYLILHEMGHTLGLTHNMRATQLHSPAQLEDRERTTRMGLQASVMDYPALHLHQDPAKHTYYATIKPGPYDIWAIQYGYTPSLPNAITEEQRVKALLNRSSEPELAYGNDADDMRSPGKGIDPRVNVNDMSNDAISYASNRIDLARNLLPKLIAKYTRTYGSHQELLGAYLTTLREMAGSASIISRYVGGVYVERTFAGQPGLKQPFTPVPASEQKRAIQVLSDKIWAPNALQLPDSLLARVQAQRRGFGFFGTSEDPKVYGTINGIQRIPLQHILHPSTLARLTHSTTYGGTYTVGQLMDDLTAGMFRADMNTAVNTSRQYLQSAYVKMLMDIASLQNPGAGEYDHVAQAEALRQLTTIRTWMKAPATTGDTATLAHRQYLALMLDKALKTN